MHLALGYPLRVYEATQELAPACDRLLYGGEKKMANCAPPSKRAGSRSATYNGMPHAQIEVHPIAEYLGQDGPAMLYTPANMEELETIFQLVVDSYNYATGRTLTRSEDAGQQ
jgi:hypothetical protein